jgi:hypothetical protein
MKKFIDGDCMCFTYDDFVNLQESPAVFVSTSDVNVQAIIRDGLYAASGEFLVNVRQQLDAQQSVQPTLLQCDFTDCNEEVRHKRSNDA